MSEPSINKNQSYTIAIYGQKGCYIIHVYVCRVSTGGVGRKHSDRHLYLRTCLHNVDGYLLSILPTDPNSNPTSHCLNAMTLHGYEGTLLQSRDPRTCSYWYTHTMYTINNSGCMVMYRVRYFHPSLWQLYLIILLCLVRMPTPSYVMRESSKLEKESTYQQPHWLHLINYNMLSTTVLCNWHGAYSTT